jgi:hypothetical protein
MPTGWISVESCDAAAQFGWLLGVVTGTVADIVIVILIATAPRLGTGRPRGPDRWQGLRSKLQHSIWLLGLVWILGGIYAGRAFVSCYAATLAIASALTIGIVLLPAMVTAANQIGARSVR